MAKMKAFFCLFITSVVTIQVMVFGEQADSNTCCNIEAEGQDKYDDKVEKLIQQCIQELGLAGRYSISFIERKLNSLNKTRKN